MTNLDQQYRDAARAKWGEDGECEFDTDAKVSDSETGAYVQAWVWVDANCLPKSNAVAYDVAVTENVRRVYRVKAKSEKEARMIVESADSYELDERLIDCDCRTNGVESIVKVEEKK